MTEHTFSVFNQELEELAGKVTTMAALVHKRFGTVEKVFFAKDAQAAEALAGKDNSIDELQREVDELTLRMLALQEPKAVDLRAIVAAQKIATDLERMGDYCSSIAKNVKLLENVNLDSYQPELNRMFQLADKMIELSTKAFVERSVEHALRAWHMDDELDELYNGFMSCLHNNLSGDDQAKAGAPLLFVAKGLERIGDHATNIAEHIYFLVMGERVPGP